MPLIASCTFYIERPSGAFVSCLATCCRPMFNVYAPHMIVNRNCQKRLFNILCMSETYQFVNEVGFFSPEWTSEEVIAAVKPIGRLLKTLSFLDAKNVDARIGDLILQLPFLQHFQFDGDKKPQDLALIAIKALEHPTEKVRNQACRVLGEHCRTDLESRRVALLNGALEKLLALLDKPANSKDFHANVIFAMRRLFFMNPEVPFSTIAKTLDAVRFHINSNLPYTRFQATYLLADCLEGRTDDQKAPIVRGLLEYSNGELIEDTVLTIVRSEEMSESWTGAFHVLSMFSDSFEQNRDLVQKFVQEYGFLKLAADRLNFTNPRVTEACRGKIAWTLLNLQNFCRVEFMQEKSLIPKIIHFVCEEASIEGKKEFMYPLLCLLLYDNVSVTDQQEQLRIEGQVMKVCIRSGIVRAFVRFLLTGFPKVYKKKNNTNGSTSAINTFTFENELRSLYILPEEDNDETAAKKKKFPWISTKGDRIAEMLLEGFGKIIKYEEELFRAYNERIQRAKQKKAAAVMKQTKKEAEKKDDDDDNNNNSNLFPNEEKYSELLKKIDSAKKEFYAFYKSTFVPAHHALKKHIAENVPDSLAFYRNLDNLAAVEASPEYQQLRKNYEEAKERLTAMYRKEQDGLDALKTQQRLLIATQKYSNNHNSRNIVLNKHCDLVDYETVENLNYFRNKYPQFDLDEDYSLRGEAPRAIVWPEIAKYLQESVFSIETLESDLQKTAETDLDKYSMLRDYDGVKRVVLEPELTVERKLLSFKISAQKYYKEQAEEEEEKERQKKKNNKAAKKKPLFSWDSDDDDDDDTSSASSSSSSVSHLHFMTMLKLLLKYYPSDSLKHQIQLFQNGLESLQRQCIFNKSTENYKNNDLADDADFIPEMFEFGDVDLVVF